MLAPMLITCPVCTRPLDPVLDREDFRFARCAECERVYLAELDAPQAPSLDGAPESPADSGRVFSLTASQRPACS